jgi:hypothetical protein
VEITNRQGVRTHYFYLDGDERSDKIVYNYDPTRGEYEAGVYNRADLYVYDRAGREIALVRNAINGDLNGDGVVTPALTIDFNADGIADYELELDPAQPGYNQITQTSYDAAGRITRLVENAWPGQPEYYVGQYNIANRTFYDRAGRVITTIQNYTESDLLTADGQPNGFTPQAYDFDGDGVTDASLEVAPDHPDLNLITFNRYDFSGRL